MEPSHFEAALEGDVNTFPFCDIAREDLSEIFNKVSPSGNSLLHVASSSGHEDMTQLIARYFPFLIAKKNSEGNTALHLAVRAQKLNTVRILVNLAQGQQIPNTTSTDTLLTVKNDEGSTALHEALLAVLASTENVDIILVEMAFCLVLRDPNVTCHQNNAGKTPLCMAIESGNRDILDYILNALNALPDQGNGLVQRLEGKPPVHVAIEHRKLDMLRIIKEQKEELLLLRDEEGNTPLHFAADIGYIEGVRYLIEIKSNWAFERNNKGFYPLHLACENGHVQVTKELFRRWPDPTELLCDKGQSILHVAAKSGKDNVVRCILKEKGTDKLVNKMDKNGNTPFHLAALHCHSMVLFTLLCDKRSKADLVNCQGLTSYDIFKSNILTKDQQIDGNDRNIEASGTVEENSADVGLKTSKKLKKFEMMMTYSMLYMSHEFFRCGHTKRHHQNSTTMSQFKIKPPTPKQELNNTINYLFVVTALVVGAAFAGALQIPFDDANRTDNAATAPASSGSDRDIINKSNLASFLLNNVITMNLSITASFILFLALLLDTNLATKLVSISFLLLEVALIFMGSAFLYAVVLRMQIIGDEWDMFFDMTINIFQQIQKTLVIISIVAFIMGRETLVLIIYFVLFWLYFPLYRLSSMISFSPLKAFIRIIGDEWSLFFGYPV
ncbi:hypothetical protein JRO89_XS01G0187800 [Xanthoceras sorbifolium]|uniref:PGG domain-containing protein n=1 Tax=Xanthoceras sorbifolium TaxID=99658 RepID=A0ABQ8IJY7_9ROSI|nr:hypothetical protein JRO89_XS01G0187800 [Xanthoceras sorbifolium]